MLFSSFLLLLVPLVSSLSHTPSIGTLRMHKVNARSVDTTAISGRYQSVNVGQYSLLNNLWGELDATSGAQTSQITSLTGNTIAWKTQWTWNGAGKQVKSYSNIQLNTGINQQLSAISTMPTAWKWKQSANGTVVADVAYDLFTSGTAGGSNVNEIMIWLANINAGPISAHYDAEGNAVPIVTNVSLQGHTWNLYSGSNGVNQVYSYVLTNGTVKSFKGDVYPFLSYLIDNEGMDPSQYLTCAQAGTEAFTGTATFTTSAYSLAIN
ncbi:glycoside hydrolase family 12 protein [Suillus clintonianus]|uniref:glycoside hydrolase family 12 protein n=1 Tax=Suillus clintonianus TaxID=1904413 RepID=UPI001B877088|nr:glycoside hydrolase family 12 protein [Suillus clintonianus]KAG2144495.1 glycoside hydrolase family 12 protein [Suillus clintonianus]